MGKNPRIHLCAANALRCKCLGNDHMNFQKELLTRIIRDETWKFITRHLLKFDAGKELRYVKERNRKVSF